MAHWWNNCQMVTSVSSTQLSNRKRSERIVSLNEQETDCSQIPSSHRNCVLRCHTSWLDRTLSQIPQFTRLLTRRARRPDPQSCTDRLICILRIRIILLDSALGVHFGQARYIGPTSCIIRPGTPIFFPDALDARKKTDEAAKTNPRARRSHRSL